MFTIRKITNTHKKSIQSQISNSIQNNYGKNSLPHKLIQTPISSQSSFPTKINTNFSKKQPSKKKTQIKQWETSSDPSMYTQNTVQNIQIQSKNSNNTCKQIKHDRIKDDIPNRYSSFMKQINEQQRQNRTLNKVDMGTMTQKPYNLTVSHFPKIIHNKHCHNLPHINKKYKNKLIDKQNYHEKCKFYKNIKIKNIYKNCIQQELIKIVQQPEYCSKIKQGQYSDLQFIVNDRLQHLSVFSVFKLYLQYKGTQFIRNNTLNGKVHTKIINVYLLLYKNLLKQSPISIPSLKTHKNKSISQNQHSNLQDYHSQIVTQIFVKKEYGKHMNQCIRAINNKSSSLLELYEQIYHKYNKYPFFDNIEDYKQMTKKLQKIDIDKDITQEQKQWFNNEEEHLKYQKTMKNMPISHSIIPLVMSQSKKDQINYDQTAIKQQQIEKHVQENETSEQKMKKQLQVLTEQSKRILNNRKNQQENIIN